MKILLRYFSVDGSDYFFYGGALYTTNSNSKILNEKKNIYIFRTCIFNYFHQRITKIKEERERKKKTKNHQSFQIVEELIRFLCVKPCNVSHKKQITNEKKSGWHFSTFSYKIFISFIQSPCACTHEKSFKNEFNELRTHH